MPVPANLTYSNIETRVMNQLRIPTTNATEQTKIQALINEVYRDIAAKKDWWWLLKRQILNTVANFTTGTVSMTNGSTSGTLTSTGTIPLLTGYRLMVSGDTTDAGATWLINTHSSAGATTFALDAGFTGATSTSYAFKLSQDTYSLATDVQKVINVRRYGRSLPLDRVGIEEMSRLKISDQTQGKPEFYAVFETATSGDPTTARQIVLHPYPDKTYRMEIEYRQMLNTELGGATRPLIPDDYVQMLIYGSLARGYAIFLNDLERGQFFQSLFNDVLALMTATQLDYERDHPSIAPNMFDRQRIRKRPSSGVTLGSLFDVFPRSP